MRARRPKHFDGNSQTGTIRFFRLADPIRLDPPIVPLAPGLPPEWSLALGRSRGIVGGGLDPLRPDSFSLLSHEIAMDFPPSEHSARGRHLLLFGAGGASGADNL